MVPRKAAQRHTTCGNSTATLDDMRGMRTRSPRAALTAAVLVGALSLGAVACGDDDVSEGVKSSTDSTLTQLGITGQWARTSPADAANGAAYFTVVSAQDDRLLSVSADPSVAAMVELHETVMDMSSETTAAMGGGQMTMRPVDGINVKAGEPLELKPGGYHVMLMELAQPLKVGDSITLTLTFEQQGDIDIDVPVLDEAP